MVRYLIFIIFFIKTSISFSQYFPIDTVKLNTAYRELMKNPGSLECQKLFFYAYPSTWLEYIMTYQYISQYTYPYFTDRDSKKYDLAMYKLCDAHKEAFEKMLPLIPDTIYCDKLINLCIGGKWDADGPGALQGLIREIMSKKPQVMINRLSKQTRGFQLRFWLLYWSSLHLVESNIAQLNKLKNMFGHSMSDQVKIMETAFEFATEEFEMHYPYENYPHLNFRGRDIPRYYF